MEKKPVKIVETVLRDGHQSLAATRMRISDMLPALEQLDNAGYYALEAWGGATFDSCLRFLNEDPWQRLRTLKKHLRKTPIQMLLRGQNILGYNHYADDVVREFVNRSVDNGVSIIRIFDALNDTRNLECAMRAAKEAGAHVQGCIVYTISPYHQDKDFVQLGKELAQMGADSICIKDMAGLLRPYAAESLIRSLKAELNLPIDLHTHFTSGMGDMTYLKAVEAGADMIDTALSPFSESTSQPCTEALVATLEGTPYDTGINLAELNALADYFKDVRKNLIHDFNLNANIPIDPKVLTFQIPGGMLSNLLNQMKEMGVADKYPQLLEEMPRVRAELGYPPLVTPTSQIVGSMSVLNVALGRYKMIPREVKDLILGKYGRTPGPIDPEVKRLAIGDAPQIDHRPADDIPPQMKKLREKLAEEGFPNAPIEDVLSYASFPEVTLNAKEHAEIDFSACSLFMQILFYILQVFFLKLLVNLFRLMQKLDADTHDTHLINLFYRKGSSRCLHLLPHLRRIIKLRINPATDSITVFGVQGQLKGIVNILQQHFAVNGIGFAALFLYLRTFLVELVLNFAYDFLQNILNSNHTCGTAVFVNEDCQLAAMLLQNAQQLADRQRFRHQQHLTRQTAQIRTLAGI